MIHFDIAKVNRVITSNPNIHNYFIWYINHCTSLTLPYHNLSHTLKMMYLIIDMYERSNKLGNSYGHQLEPTDLYILLTSALFHDYNHSGGRFSDTINVQNAITGLRECMHTYLEDSENTEIVIEQCVDVIKGTEFPYVIPDDELTMHQRILRECDLLVAFFDDYITHNIFGLAEEMKGSQNISEFIAKQIEFMQGSLTGLQLPYSREIINENIQSYMENVKTLLGIFVNVAKN